MQYRDQVVLTDLKASTRNTANTPANEQIRNAAQSRDALGGLSAQAVMLRPNWAADRDLQALAGANRVGLMDANQMPRIFQKLAGLLGLDAEPTEGMQALQAFHENCKQRGHAHAASRAGRTLPRTETAGPCIDVDAACDESMRMRGANWYAVRFNSQIHLQFMQPAKNAARGDYIARPIRGGRTSARNSSSDTSAVVGNLAKSGQSARLQLHDFAKDGIKRLMNAIQNWPAQIDWRDEVDSLLQAPNNNGPEEKPQPSRQRRSSYGKKRKPVKRANDERGPMAQGLAPLKAQMAGKPSEDRNQ